MMLRCIVLVAAFGLPTASDECGSDEALLIQSLRTVRNGGQQDENIVNKLDLAEEEDEQEEEKENDEAGRRRRRRRRRRDRRRRDNSPTAPVDPVLPPVLPPAPETLEQFTPDQADWSTFELIFADNQLAHDPDSILWIPQIRWEEARWDGTPYNPSEMSKEELGRAICVGSGDTVRGIREVFYEHNPFADNRYPTKAEVDNWHRIALNHVRALVGYTGPEYEAMPDHCLFAQALWGNQRLSTADWDEAYPGPGSHCAGPCSLFPGGCAGHCGSTFLPDSDDQAPFLAREGAPESCTLSSASTGQGRSEGIFNSCISRIPWSIKWSRSFCTTLNHEGFWGGHTGPWFHRQKFGWSFWDDDPTDSQSNAVLRAKWSGNLLPNLYEQP